MSAGSASLRGSTITRAHYNAFLSHNGADKPLVKQVDEELERRGLSCWLDEWNLVPGNPWQPAIEEALGQCETCVVFFGPHGLGPWHNEEMRLAIQRRVGAQERKLRVLPVILPGGERAKEGDLPGFLQGTTWVEFRRSLDEEYALHRLVCGIKGIPPGRRPGAAILEGECPYLGLKTFQPEDAPLFFGRTAKVQELIDHLRNNFGTPKEERFLALIGASGSGKSSLALAGLLHSLQRDELPASAKWPLVRCRPGTRPWENLQIALSTNQQIALHMAALPALIIRPEDEQRRLHLTAQLALHDHPENHRLFILIDQFEEIFTACNDEGARRQLIDNVLYATNVAGGRTIVVLTVRADFYGQCASYTGLRAAIADHQSLIGPLSEEELREAIESPAQLAGGELESGLMELLLADMKGQAGALPFLEHALFKLWEMRDGRRLTAKAYTDMGRLAGALDAHAEEFFTKTLSAEEQFLCCQILLDLVHPGEGAADTKKRVSSDDVAPSDAARAVLKKLADARLVTTGRDDLPGLAQAELTHEALINGWRRLSEWVNENREKSRLKERLLDSGREWQRSSKKEDFLYRGAQLATAQEIFGSSAELPKIGREFLEASIAARKRAQEEKQREQRRRQRLLAAASAVLALLAVVASAAAIFGFLQKGKADNQAERATSEEKQAKEGKAEAERQAMLAREAEHKIAEASSQANVSLAQYMLEDGKDVLALAHLAQALRLDPKNEGAGALTGAMLIQTSWPFLVADPMRHDSAIYLAQFSPDGQRVVTASSDKTARVWDAATGKALGEPMKHEGKVYSAQFSPDGRRVVTASDDKTARVWDAATGKALGEPMKHEDKVYSAQFSPDGQRVVTASGARTARVWNAVSGKPIGEPIEHGDVVAYYQLEGEALRGAGELKVERPLFSAQFSPDGQRVVTASRDKTARVWDAATGKQIGEPMKHEGEVNSVQFSPDGQRVVTASRDKTARVWDAATGEQIGEPMKHEDEVLSAQFSPDGQRVVTASSDKTAQVWDAATGKALGEPMQHDGEVNSAQFTPDGQRVVTASSDKTARVWDVATGKALGEPMQHDGIAYSAQFSPDGQRVVTASFYSTARVWDALTGKAIGEPMQHEDKVYSAQFSPDGQRVVTASSDKTARVWDAATGKALGEPMKHEDKVYSAQFSPDGQRVVTASSDQTARVWDAATGKQIGESMKHEDNVNSAQFSPDGRRVVTASDDKTARVWDAATGKQIGEPMKHEGGVNSAQFSPDGRRVVTASADKTARLWDAASGKAIGEPMRHEGEVNSAQFSPDGQRVVTASYNTARVWDAATGKAIGKPMQHEDNVNSAQFSPDGQRVVTASGEPSWVEGTGEARVWDVPTTRSQDTRDDVLLLAEFAEAASGSVLQTFGQAEILKHLPLDQVRAAREKIAAKFEGQSLKLTPVERLLKWSISDPRVRTISPFSKLTFSEWVESKIKEGIPNGLRTAVQADPANARLAAHFGWRLADHALKEGDPDEARRARADADFQTRRALKLAPDNDEVKKLRAEVAKLLQLPE